MKNILLGHSGGTAASMSAFSQYFVQNTEGTCEVSFVPRMWRTMAGLENHSTIKATSAFVSGWDKIGGAPIIPSCKDTNVFKIKFGEQTLDLSDNVYQFCKGYDGVLAVGGGGTTLQCQALNQVRGINSLVALATMDNDIICFDDMLGFQTAVQNAGMSIVSAVNDAMTMQRPTLVFSMGYDCGRLTVNATKYAMQSLKKLGYGKIDLLQIPETKTAIEDVVKAIKTRYTGGAFTIVMSEGCAATLSGTDDGEHKKYKTTDYAKEIINLTGIDFKVLNTDYRQRSGAPVRKDVLLAKRFAAKASELISQDKWNYVIGSFEGKVIARPIDEVSYILNTQKPSLHWFNAKNLCIGEVRDILI